MTDDIDDEFEKLYAELQGERREHFDDALALLRGYTLEGRHRTGTKASIESALRRMGSAERIQDTEQNAADMVAGVLEVAMMLLALRQLEHADSPGPAATLDYLQAAFRRASE